MTLQQRLQDQLAQGSASSILTRGLPEAQAKLTRELRALLDNVGASLPATPVHAFHSCAWSEDGASMSVFVDMQDGSTLMLGITPGRPVSVLVQEV